MATKEKCGTGGCAGDTSAPGSGNGRCPRCYNWIRRHPDGPPPSSAPRGPAERTEPCSIRLSPAEKRAAKKLAKGRGMPLITWIRQLVLEAIQ